MRILVTGACGFIGSHLVEKLIKNNYKTVDALTLTFRVLKYHHPEIPDYKIPKEVAIIINTKLKEIL